MCRNLRLEIGHILADEKQNPKTDKEYQHEADKEFEEASVEWIDHVYSISVVTTCLKFHIPNPKPPEGGFEWYISELR